MKQVASHLGGTRNGLAVSWPRKIAAAGEQRSQFHHVIDIAPTILDAAGIEAPVRVNGIEQKPIEGVSMVYTFDDGERLVDDPRVQEAYLGVLPAPAEPGPADGRLS